MTSQFLYLKQEDLVFLHLEEKLHSCPYYGCQYRKGGLCWNCSCYELQVYSKKESYIIWKSCGLALAQWMIEHKQIRISRIPRFKEV